MTRIPLINLALLLSIDALCAAPQAHSAVVPLRIEIGNEVFYGSYKWAFPTGADYVMRARKLAAVIRKVLPDTKVGVVIPNQVYQDERLLAGDRPGPLGHPYGWISGLNGETFFDAVVLHPYSPTGMSNDCKPADFIPHLEAYKNCDAHLDRSMDKTLGEAMQDTERCERRELPVSNSEAINLPPHSITRLAFARP